MSNCEQVGRALSFDERDNFLCALPLFHSFAGTVCQNTALRFGARVTLIEQFHPARVAEAMSAHGVTIFPAVPAMYGAMMQLPPDFDGAFRHVRLCVSGGAPMPVALMQAFERRFGVVILEGDGPTECSPVTSVNPLNGVRKPGTIGLPVPGVEMKIVDEDDRDVPAGQVGEIVVRGENVMIGYLNQPDATAVALRGGWYHTGDLGTMDADGYFAIVDRKKDMLIVGGINVYPREVEEVLYQHPAVQDAAVIGGHDEKRGEQVVAVIALKPGAMGTSRELLHFCRERLANYKCPRKVIFRDALPRERNRKGAEAAVEEGIGAGRHAVVQLSANVTKKNRSGGFSGENPPDLFILRRPVPDMRHLLILTAEPEEYRQRIEAAGLPDLSIVASSDVDEGLRRGAHSDLLLGDPARVRLALPFLPRLEWAQVTWAGIEPMLDSSLRRDYVLTNVRGAFGPLMSEYVFAYLLLHERKVLKRVDSQRAGRWDATPPGMLQGKTMGLVGVGSIGAHLAATAKHFGMRVHGYTRSSRSSPDVDQYFHGEDKAAFASGVDYLVVVLPHTPETRAIVDRAMIGALPPHAFLINAGRGPTLDEAALIEALTAGRLAGAVLDVFPEEPLAADHPFWRTPNLFMTCHTAAPSFPVDAVRVFVSNYRRFVAGEPLLYRVDFERGY